MKSSWICCGLFKKKPQERSQESTEMRAALVSPVPEIMNAQAPYKIPEPEQVELRKSSLVNLTAPQKILHFMFPAPAKHVTFVVPPPTPFSYEKVVKEAERVAKAAAKKAAKEKVKPEQECPSFHPVIR